MVHVLHVVCIPYNGKDVYFITHGIFLFMWPHPIYIYTFYIILSHTDFYFLPPGSRISVLLLLLLTFDPIV